MTELLPYLKAHRELAYEVCDHPISNDEHIEGIIGICRGLGWTPDDIREDPAQASRQADWLEAEGNG